MLSSLSKRSPFLLLKAVFLRLELLRGTTIAAVIGQAVVDLKLVRHYHLSFNFKNFH